MISYLRLLPPLLEPWEEAGGVPSPRRSCMNPSSLMSREAHPPS